MGVVVHRLSGKEAPRRPETKSAPPALWVQPWKAGRRAAQMDRVPSGGSVPPSRPSDSEHGPLLGD